MNNFKFLFLSFALFTVACSSNSSSADESSSLDEKNPSVIETSSSFFEDGKRGDEAEILKRVLDGMPPSISFYSCDGCNPLFFTQENYAVDVDLSQTIVLNAFARDVVISIPYVDTTMCNYENTKVFVDGKEIKYDEITPLYKMKFNNLFSSLTEEHLIEFATDSVNCGNIKRHYKIERTKEPGAVHQGLETIHNSGYCIPLSNFNIKVYEDFLFSQPLYVWDLDTLNSKCYLVHGTDSIEMDISYQKDYDWKTASQLRYGIASLDSENIANLLQGDTLVTMSCDIIYHDWIVHKDVDSLSFTKKEFIVKNYPKARLSSVEFDRNGMLVLQSSMDFPDIVFARTSVNGIQKAYFQTRTTQAVLMPIEDIYGGLPSSATDSIQLIAIKSFKYNASVEENEIRNILSKLPYTNLPSLPEKWLNDSTIAILDSIISIVTDEAGNIKPEYYFMDAKRIPGYENTHE